MSEAGLRQNIMLTSCAHTKHRSYKNVPSYDSMPLLHIYYYLHPFIDYIFIYIFHEHIVAL